MKAVILCAGNSSRLFPLTKAVPKALLPIGALPAVQHIVDELTSAGISEIGVVLNHEGEAISRYFEGTPNITCITQDGAPKGPADSLSYARDWLNRDNFVLAYGDSLMLGEETPGRHVERMVELGNARGCGAVLLGQPITEQEVCSYGVLRKGSLRMRHIYSGDFYSVESVIEKPNPEQTSSRTGIAGRFFFRNNIFDYIERTEPGVNGELQITDTINLLCKHTVVIGTCADDGAICQDIGTLQNYMLCNKYFIEEN